MKRNNVLIFGVSIVFAAAAFLAAIGTGPSTQEPRDPHLSGLLKLSQAQIEAIDEADPAFDKEAAELSARLDEARGELAKALEDDDATDARILDHVESVIEAHGELERRVARHVLQIRDQLEPEQRTRLMGLCAEGVRAGQQHRYRHGQEAGGGRGGNGLGGGNAEGNGGGEGRGRYRGGRGAEGNP